MLRLVWATNKANKDFQYTLGSADTTIEPRSTPMGYERYVPFSKAIRPPLSICSYVDDTTWITKPHRFTATVGNHGQRITSHTVINRLTEHGIPPRCPYDGPQLLPRHGPARLQWCRAHLAWQARQCNRVLLSDESRFS